MILVVGADGQLGTAFRHRLGGSATYASRGELDLSVPGAATSFVREASPSLIINCAAYTAVDAAESDEQGAFLINRDAVAELAEASRDAGCRLVSFSTDYVFDGTNGPYVESDTPNPLSVYGASKLAGERAALKIAPDSLIIRTSWLLSGTHRNSVSTILGLAMKGPVSVVTDQRGHPTMSEDLVDATMAAVERGATGVLHLTNAGETSWFDLARTCAVIAGVDVEEIQPCTTADMERPAPRPMHSTLVSERLTDLGLVPMPHYRAALEIAIPKLLSLVCDQGLS